jgi:putative endonuclease
MPSRTTSDQNLFYYIYVLESKRDGNRYIGMTQDLRKRFLEHQNGRSRATASRRPFELIYYEACRSYQDTKQREQYMKTTEGRRFITKRLRNYFMRNPKLS